MDNIRHIISDRRLKLEDLTEGDNLSLDFTRIEDADMQGLSVDGLSIRYASLWSVNLSNANLKGANFFFSRVNGSDFHGINLEGANLQNVRLHDVNLQNANLSGANLLMTSFSGSILDGCRVQFHKFTELKNIISLRLGNLPEYLNAEVLKRGPLGETWGPNKPKTSNTDLLIEICRFKGWGIDGLLNANN